MTKTMLQLRSNNLYEKIDSLRETLMDRKCFSYVENLFVQHQSNHLQIANKLFFQFFRISTYVLKLLNFLTFEEPTKFFGPTEFRSLPTTK